MAPRLSRRLVLAAACGTLIVPIAAGAAQASPERHRAHAPVVVVSGLNNPRQLSLVGDDVLLIAEAGKGGTLGTFTSPDGELDSLGYTGSISAVHEPEEARGQHPHRIVTGLLSAASASNDPNAPPKGGFALGPDGVSARSLNRIGIIETTFGPAVPAAAKARDGHLLLARPHGSIRAFADITGFEAAHDPDHHGVDSDPYAVLAYGKGWLVADAAGNDVLKVDRRGHISVFHVFPNVTTGACAGQFDPSPQFPGCNFVPTSLVSDRWGNVYVGGLSSLTPGEAQVVKLDDDGHVLQVWHGFTSVTGVALGRDGSLYVSQLFAPEAHPIDPMIQGVVTRVHGSTRTNMDVPFPAGLAVDEENVYVSAFSVLPDTGAGLPGIDTSGQVWRLRF
ncbi:MAG: repeat protein [Pseudonocardiales bacterium]|nr:repeat protein [Pseudonocardiales bacterium]